MALPTSGPISLFDIASEFNGILTNIQISAYYRGGTFVDDTIQNNNVPTFGTISIGDFYGAENDEGFGGGGGPGGE